MWSNHMAPTGRCSRNVPSPANQQRMRGRYPEVPRLLTNQMPAGCDAGPDNQERLVLPASVLKRWHVGV